MIERIRRLPYERQILIVYILAVFITVIDGTMVNVALPAMADDFGIEANEAEWVAVGYLLAVASVIPAAGWLGDRFGSKRIFMGALATFTVMSVVCGTARTLDQLVVYRVLQGLGGGVLVPIGSAIVFRAFPVSQRATAANAVLSVAVIAPSTGPLLGGVLVDQASWHWIFLINLPIGAIGLAFAWLTMREDREHAAGAGDLDIAGLVLSAGSVSLLIYTLSVGPERGWSSGYVLGLGAVGVLALVTLIAVELRHPAPMLAIGLFRDHHFRVVNGSAALMYAGFFGLILILPIYLQTLRGYSATVSGLVSVTQPVGVFLMSNLIGRRAYVRLGPRPMMVAGGLAAGLITCAYALADLDTSLWVLGGLGLARGLAMGFVFLAIQTAVYSTTSVPAMARATSMFNTQRQVAYATGTALAATVLTGGLQRVGEVAPAIDRLPPHQWAFLAVGLLMFPGVLMALFIRDDDVAESRGLVPAAVASE